MNVTRGRVAKAIVILAAPAILVAMIFVVTTHSPTAPWNMPQPVAQAARASLSARGTPGFVLGVYEHGIPGPWAPIARFAAVTGTNPNLVLYYSNWREPFRYGFAKTAAAHGTALLVQIQPWSTPLAMIAAGHYDRYLRAYAQEVQQFHQSVVIGFAHEMNGHWYPWGYGHESAVAFVAAWRHIVTLFRSAGATNVIWLWTVSSGVPPRRQLRDYWPGARYVTWVGIDGYYQSRGQTFSKVFGHAIHQVRRLTKDPILLSETAIGPAAGQARMMPNLFAGIQRNHLLGIVWFDVVQHGGLANQTWRLEGHPAAVATFRSALLNLRGSNAAVYEAGPVSGAAMSPRRTPRPRRSP